MVGSALTPAYMVEANLREAMQCYSYATSAGERREYPGVVISSSGLRYSVFNSAMLTEPVADDRDLERRITTAAVHFAARRFGWTFWICEELLPPTVASHIDRIFSAHRLRVLTTAPGMYTEELAAEPYRETDLEFRLVSDARTRFDFCDVACVVFALPFRISYQIYAEPGYWTSGVAGFVGYRRSKPVTIVSVVPAGGAAGIYSLGTLPQHQRCGYGEALMRFALNETASSMGIVRTVLQATDAGFPLYRRMGYKTVTRFRIYEHFGGPVE